ncbi:MAG: hypothetical protein ACJAVV_001208 [Alphaproteobacteria bacterium]|jgi:hypothetical protein
MSNLIKIAGGIIGFYRLIVKGGWPFGDDIKKIRGKLKLTKWIITLFILVHGVFTLVPKQNSKFAIIGFS